MARVVWTRRLFKVVTCATLIFVTCVGLGFWQIARLHQKQQFNAAVRAGLALAPEPFSTVVPPGADPDAIRYRRAEASGTYDVDREIVLYGRSHDGQAGNHLLTPLVLDDGTAVIVDRGWVPVSVSKPGDPVAAPPGGPVDVEGVLFRSEGDLPGAIGSSSESQATLAHVDLARIQAQLPYRIAPVYLLLQTQSPAQASGLPLRAALPELSEGPHRGYAIQWFTFAVIAIIGCVVLVLREESPSEERPSPRAGGSLP